MAKLSKDADFGEAVEAYQHGICGLENLCDTVLAGILPESLRAALDAALAAGATRQQILERVRRALPARRTLTVLAVEAYLRAGQDGKVTR